LVAIVKQTPKLFSVIIEHIMFQNQIMLCKLGMGLNLLPLFCL